MTETDIIASLCYQFAYRMDDPPRLSTGGLSSLKDAFYYLGWSDPYKVDEKYKCDVPRCGKWGNCGWPSKDGYRRTCGEHIGKGFDHGDD